MTTFPANRTVMFQKFMALNSLRSTGDLILDYQNLKSGNRKGLVIAAICLSLVHRGISPRDYKL